MLLDVKNLQVAYGKIKALHGIDFHINDGEIVTIIWRRWRREKLPPCVPSLDWFHQGLIRK